MFHRQFPEVKISASTLQRIYFNHKIKFKSIKRIKRQINFSQEPIKSQLIQLNASIYALKQKGFRILYLDEAVFTFNSFQGRAWSHKNSNIAVTEEQTSIKTQALLAAISLENGVDHYCMYERSVKHEDFRKFLLQLR